MTMEDVQTWVLAQWGRRALRALVALSGSAGVVAVVHGITGST